MKFDIQLTGKRADVAKAMRENKALPPHAGEFIAQAVEALNSAPLKPDGPALNGVMLTAISQEVGDLVNVHLTLKRIPMAG